MTVWMFVFWYNGYICLVVFSKVPCWNVVMCDTNRVTTFPEIFFWTAAKIWVVLSCYCFLWIFRYRKFPKYSDTQNICCNHSKIWTMWLFYRVMSPNDTDRMANSVDPDQTAPLGAVWSESALFAQTYLSKNLGSLGYCILYLCWKYFGFDFDFRLSDTNDKSYFQFAFFCHLSMQLP